MQAIFTDDFLGGDGDPNQRYFVVSGAFRRGNWAMADRYDDTDDEFDDPIDPTMPLTRLGLQRHFNQNVDVPLPIKAHVDTMLNVKRPYDASPYNHATDINASMRAYLEGRWPTGPSMHNSVHVWVGGQMQTSSLPMTLRFFCTTPTLIASGRSGKSGTVTIPTHVKVTITTKRDFSSLDRSLLQTHST